MRVIKNREIFLVQIATRPFPKHIYRSLRSILNSTLTRNEFESFQTQPIHKIEGFKPCIYTFYTKTRQIPYKTLDFHTRIHTCDLLFPFLLSSLLFSSSSLLSVYALSFSKTKMRYLFWSCPYLILSPFYFNFFFLLLFFFFLLELP